MTASITCICGYRGPSVPDGGYQVCPLCRGRVRGSGWGPGSDDDDDAGAGFVDEAEQADDEAEQADETPCFHIPCPKGHVLRVREDLLSQQVCCPTCSEFFVLRASDSIEYRRQQARKRAAAEEKAARAWLTRAIVAALLVGASLVAMLVIGSSPEKFGK